MKNILILCIAIILFSSCKTDKKHKIVNAENSDSEIMELEKDSSLIEISDIPIHIDSTKYLIHPIGELSLYNSRSKIYKSDNYSSRSFNISSFSGQQITGNFSNLKFQPLDSENLTSLTTKNIRIKSVKFLRELFNSTKKQILIYQVFDKDTNRDNELNQEDIETLYMSNIDGTDFLKLTVEFQELIDWKLLEINNRLYFRSIEDTNENGEFDKEDKVHYQYIDFNKNENKVIEYNPI